MLADADSRFEAWKARAQAAEVKAATLEGQLQAECAKNAELVDNFWPLAAKLKALEAQLSNAGSSN